MDRVLTSSAPGPEGPRHLSDSPGVSERIRERIGELSVAGRRVAGALLDQPLTIWCESSARLAQQAGVSRATVSRFVTALGFSDYAAFRRAVHQEIATRLAQPVKNQPSVVSNHRSKDVLSTREWTLGNAVTASLAGLNADELSRGAHLLTQADHVFVMGRSFNGLLADYLVSALCRNRPGIRLVGQSVSDCADAILEMTRRDTVTAFDFRSYDRDVLELARAARAAGAKVLLLTDPCLSPIADIADVVLIAENILTLMVPSLTPPLAVLETLILSVGQAQKRLGPPG